MKLRLIESKVLELQFQDMIGNSNERNSFELTYTVNRLESQKFEVQFILEILDPKVFALDLCHNFVFETDEEITDNESDFKNNPFFNQNAPAIAYPYIRAFISTLMLNAGYPALMLPSINLVEYTKRKKA